MRSILVLAFLGACGEQPEEDTSLSEDSAVETVSFSRDIQPIFDDNCVSCHQTNGYIAPSFEAPLGETLLGTAQHCEDGEIPFVVPGDPDASFLVFKIGGGGDLSPTGQECRSMMPSRADKKSLADLDPDAVANIRQWIIEGAHTE
jgi:hypothetical protein